MGGVDGAAPGCGPHGGLGGRDEQGAGDQDEQDGEQPQDTAGPVTVADSDAVGGVEGTAGQSPAARDGLACLPALGDQDGFGAAGVPVLPENAGGLLVGAGVIGRLPGEPGASGDVVPGRAGGRAFRLAEAVVGEARDDELGRPVTGIVRQEGSHGVSEVDARGDGRQARYMPPRTVAEMASTACPCGLRSAGAGQVNDPPSHSSLPSMWARLRSTSPSDLNPATSTTDPLTVAWCRLRVKPPGLTSWAPSGNHVTQRGVAESEPAAVRVQVPQVRRTFDHGALGRDEGPSFGLAQAAPAG